MWRRTGANGALRSGAFAPHSQQKWCLAGMGMKIAKHRGMARPRVAVARKLATILHRMWIDDAEFRFGHEPAATPDVKTITVVAA